MKLIDFNKYTLFYTLRRKMGISDDAQSNITLNAHQWKGISKEKIDQLKGYIDVLEVPLQEIEISNDGSFKYRGFKVILYIRDQMGYYTQNNGYRYHLSDCKTLEDMRNHKRYDKYVVSTRNDGRFLVNILDHGILLHKNIECELFVCKNCLRRLNYKRYNDKSGRERDAIWNSFTISDYFNKYSSMITHIPSHNEITAPINQYDVDQRRISDERRQYKNWKCEKCGIQLNIDKEFLHVHHINGQKNDNDDSNLKVLCIKCHAEEPDHNHIKNLPEYMRFINNYGYDTSYRGSFYTDQFKTSIHKQPVKLLSYREAREELIALRENEIRPLGGDPSKGILKKQMLELLLKNKPRNEREFWNNIPIDIKNSIDVAQYKFISKIVSITKRMR